MNTSKKAKKIVTVLLVVVLILLAVVFFLGKIPVGIRHGSPSSGLPGAATNGLDIVVAARSQIGVQSRMTPRIRSWIIPTATFQGGAESAAMSSFAHFGMHAE